MSDFLVDASLPRSTGDLIRQHGHQATDVRDTVLGTASDIDMLQSFFTHWIRALGWGTMTSVVLPNRENRFRRRFFVPRYPVTNDRLLS
jgi:hypothetical protein